MNAGIYTEIDALSASEMRDVVLQFALAHPAGYEAAVRNAHIVAQAAASRANPYGSYAETKHGRFDAPSAAAVARGVPHLPQRGGGNPRCTFCGTFHEVAVRSDGTVVIPASALAGHMPEGAL